MAIESIRQTVAGRDVLSATLLSGVTSATDGEWIEVLGYPRASVHITGIGTATVEVRGSNAPTKPLNTTHEVLLATQATDGLIVINHMPMRWIKVRVVTYTAGTISAYLIALG